MATPEKVKIKGSEELSINGALFAGMRKKFDEVLSNGIQKITEKGISDMTLTMKLTIKLEENDSEDTPNADTYIPLFDYKIGAAYTEKQEATGVTGGADIQLIKEDSGKLSVRNDPYGQMELDLGN